MNVDAETGNDDPINGGTKSSHVPYFNWTAFKKQIASNVQTTIAKAILIIFSFILKYGLP